MLEVQALKFERLFNKATDLTIYKKDHDKLLEDLLKLQVKEKATDLAYRVFMALKKAKQEGRIKVVDPDSSAG